MANRHLTPQRELNHVISTFVDQAETQIIINMKTQTIFPNEIYTGFNVVNQIRRIKAQNDHTKGWFAEGTGEKSFKGEVLAADPGNVHVVFTYDEHLRYAELGVGGKGRTAETIDRSRKARFKSRYISKWDWMGGRTHRPAIMMELRHLERRMSNYITDFYASDAESEIIGVFTDLDTGAIRTRVYKEGYQ